MKKLFFYAAALLAAISFSACSDDDDENGLSATPENIAGTWQIVSEAGYEIYDGQKDTWSDNFPDEYGRYYMYTFNKNGTLTTIEHEYDDEGDGAYIENHTGSYSISGNTLIIVKDYDYDYDYDNDDYDNDKYEIRELTKSKLVLFDKYDEPDYSFEETLTFKRIE